MKRFQVSVDVAGAVVEATLSFTYVYYARSRIRSRNYCDLASPFASDFSYFVILTQLTDEGNTTFHMVPICLTLCKCSFFSESHVEHASYFSKREFFFESHTPGPAHKFRRPGME